MAHIDILIRARQKGDVGHFHDAIPTNFQFLDPADSYNPLPGVSVVTQGLNPLSLHQGTPETATPSSDWVDPPVFSSWFHANVRIGQTAEAYSRLILDSTDTDPTIDKNKVRRWFRNNGVTRIDGSTEHPRTGSTSFTWYRWSSGVRWVDITQGKPGQRRGIWFGDTENPDL